MKYFSSVILIAIFNINAFSQIQFEKGYFISNKNEKIECLIRNNDWKNNPTEFDFKLTKDSESQSLNISTIKEFSIPGSFKFIRAPVKIDRSTDIASLLGTDRNPKWESDTLFLKVLVEGKATLYSYSKGNLFRFFFKK